MLYTVISFLRQVWAVCLVEHDVVDFLLDLVVMSVSVMEEESSRENNVASYKRFICIIMQWSWQQQHNRLFLRKMFACVKR